MPEATYPGILGLIRVDPYGRGDSLAHTSGSIPSVLARGRGGWKHHGRSMIGCCAMCYLRTLKRTASALNPARPHDATVRTCRPGLILRGHLNVAR